MESGLLNRKLTREERAELLEELYGFSLVNDAEPNQKPHDIIYDDDGMEFYGKDENCQFDLETLADFFKYSRHLAESAGVRKSQWEIKKALGLI